MPLILFLGLLFLQSPHVAGSQEDALNILVLGSTHSFSETNEAGVKPEPSFDPTRIADELRQILEADSAVQGSVNVVVEDIYRTKTLPTALGQGGSNFDFDYRCFSLAQYFMWPEDRERRLANLRGEDGTDWSHVVIMGDPYLLTNMPGIHAEGVNLVADEVAKGGARALLLMQWPGDGSNYGIDHFSEVSYRIGDSAKLPVVPAGIAWDAWADKDAAGQHPTPDGAYLAAASIYGQIFSRSASTSDYERDDALADHALATLLDMRERSAFEGPFTFASPFSMAENQQRHLDYNQTGSSSEAGIQRALNAAMQRSMVTFKRHGAPPWADGIAPVDFNFGRGNSNFEPNKRYMLDPALYKLSFGFPMQEQRNSAATTMLYGIDKRYGYDDGTDLGIAYDMIRLDELEFHARAIPMRLMWAKIHDVKPELSPLRDAWHMSRILDEASGTYMYTLISGRTPVEDEPADRESDDWNRWLGRKVGYETAWRMAHLTSRVPGFQVRPSSTKAEETESFTVRFMYPPEQEVTVWISSDQPEALGADPERLVFTPENHSSPQTVATTGYVGADPETDYLLRFTTESEDAIFDGLMDSWTVRVVDPVATAPPTSVATQVPTASATPTAVPATSEPTSTVAATESAQRVWLPMLER